MLDSIINLVKSQLSETVGQNADVPTDKKEHIVEIATSSVMDSLKSNFTLDKLSSLTSLFGSEDNTASSNEFVSEIQNSVTSSLSDKLGLDKNIVSDITSGAISAIISTFKKNINDPNNSDFNIQSLIKSFSGNEKGGSVLGMIGSLLGK